MKVTKEVTTLQP